jgi:hypothetical protein
MKRISEAGDNLETIIDSALKKPLLSLHGRSTSSHSGRPFKM